MNSSFTGQQRSTSSSSSSTATSFNNYNFDFGIGSGRNNSSRPLKDQKDPSVSASATPMPSTASRPAYSTPTPTFSSWAPNKSSWTHQPSPNASSAPRSGLSNPTSMVGDISGRSWTSAAPSTATAAGIGLPKSDPTLFGDLLGSALGQGRSSSSKVPLKSAPPKNSFSMGNISDSLPKTATSNPVRQKSWGSAENLGSYSSVGNQMGGSKTGTPLGGGPSVKWSASTPMMGGSSMKSSTATGSGSMMGGSSMKSAAATGSTQKVDPFGSLMDFSSKPSTGPSPSLNSNPKGSNGSGSGGGDYAFGTFQNSNPKGTSATDDYDFGAFQNSNPPKSESFGVPPPDFSSQKPQASQPNMGVDPLETLFASSASSAPVAASDSQPFAEANDWDLGAEFGGNDGGGTTTELEGLPPPPAGVTASTAKSKGLDNYKQGQFADAIKWLSWAVVILEKSGDQSAMTDVLICRASCYKEVGEYKKAVADCSKVLENDGQNVSVLVQRALLYESTEKYKLGAEDLRAVLKIDPANRVARTTIHRLNQLAG